MARPRKPVDAAEIARLRQEGLSWNAIARRARVGRGTVARAHQQAQATRTMPQPSQNLPKTILETTPEDDNANPAAQAHLDPLPEHGEPPVLGAVYQRQNAADQLQLKPDGSFILQEAGRAYHGSFSLVLKSPEFRGGQATATVQGDSLVDGDGCTWVRADTQSGPQPPVGFQEDHEES